MGSKTVDTDDEQSYPLGDHRHRLITGTGRPLAELTLESIRAGTIGSDDLTIHPETLRVQAAIAERAGFPQLAANLRRAAELAGVPQETVLAVYEALRPYRVRHEELLALADMLESQYEARESAALVREAAAAYRQRGLL